MKSILFKNKGLLDLDFVKSFGVSVKDNDDPIGFFGTGLKYAIAIILREKHKISVYLGKDLYEFGTVKKIKRGKSFDFITLNGETLGYTTELGKNWEMWQAFRELYSNCNDEGGTVSRGKIKKCTEDNHTVISVEGCEFDDWFTNRNQIVLSSDPLSITIDANIHNKDKGTIFYKGIRVLREQSSLFDYNINQHLDLTEDRTIKWSWELEMRISNAWLGCHDEALLMKALTAKKGTFEASLNFDRTKAPTEEFLRSVEIAVEAGIGNVNPSAIKKCQSLSERLSPVMCDLSSVQKSQLEKAKKVLSFMGYDVNRYSLIVAEDLGNLCLGMAKNDTIYIAKRCFHMGTKMVTSTMFEEYLHLRHNLEDNTYEMQNFLFDIIFTTIEEYAFKEAI